jgi:hypothetical protein
MAQEISEINREMDTLGKDYILIGPGRWDHATRTPAYRFCGQTFRKPV